MFQNTSIRWHGVKLTGPIGATILTDLAFGLVNPKCDQHICNAECLLKPLVFEVPVIAHRWGLAAPAGYRSALTR
jgi:hypothetical protein